MLDIRVLHLLELIWSNSKQNTSKQSLGIIINILIVRFISFICITSSWSDITYLETKSPRIQYFILQTTFWDHSESFFDYTCLSSLLLQKSWKLDILFESFSSDCNVMSLLLVTVISYVLVHRKPSASLDLLSLKSILRWFLGKQLWNTGPGSLAALACQLRILAQSSHCF